MLDKDQEFAVVVLAGLALRALNSTRDVKKAREHLEDIQAVLLGGAAWAKTIPVDTLETID